MCVCLSTWPDIESLFRICDLWADEPLFLLQLEILFVIVKESFFIHGNLFFLESIFFLKIIFIFSLRCCLILKKTCIFKMLPTLEAELP